MSTVQDQQIKILIVDDNKEQGSNLETLLNRVLSDLSPNIRLVDNFPEGEALLRAQGFDLAVLDVRLGDSNDPSDEDAGRRVYERVAEAQWLPVIFWTGVPSIVEHLEHAPLVQVVNKRDIRNVPQLVRAALDSGVPQFARQVASEVETAVRGFLSKLVASQWDEMSPAEKRDVLPLLANRLSYYLRNRLLDELHLRGSAPESYDHPSSARYYLMPPVSNELTTGDVFAHGEEWWVLVTPQCDMEIRRNGTRKVQYLRLLRAVPPEETDAGRAFIEAKSGQLKGVTSKVTSILGDDHRYFYLPAYLKIPHLVVDFEQVASFRKEELLPPETAALNDPLPRPGRDGSAKTWTRIATIDSPYSEAMLYRLSRAVSRVGIEEIPPEAVIAHLTKLQQAAEKKAHVTPLAL